MQTTTDNGHVLLKLKAQMLGAPWVGTNVQAHAMLSDFTMLITV